MEGNEEARAFVVNPFSDVASMCLAWRLSVALCLYRSDTVNDRTPPIPEADPSSIFVLFLENAKTNHKKIWETYFSSKMAATFLNVLFF